MAVTEFLTELKSVIHDSKIKLSDGARHSLGNSGDVIVYPETEEEISDILKFANDNRKKITIVSGGTKRGFGGQREVVDILLSLERYKGIIEHTVGDMTLTVKAGTPFKELQDYLEKHNQQIPMDPSWPENATIGGVIAANDSGPKRLGYGAARDSVIGLRVIYPDGKVIRTGGKVVKNVAGYDMNKLFIGSMGTIGILSEVTLKLRPLPKYESLVLLSFPEGSLDTIRSFVIRILDSMMEPVSLELLNPTLSERLTGQKVYTLAINFEDVESSVHYQEDFVKKNKPEKTQMTILAQKDSKAFWNKFYTIGPNGGLASNDQPTEASLKVGVKNLDVLNVLKESTRSQDANNLHIEAHGGLGHGLCQINLKGSSKDVISSIHQLRNAVHELGGYLIVKHLPFVLREKVNVWGDKPAYFFLMEGIKTKIDPHRILNDKRFVGGL